MFIIYSLYTKIIIAFKYEIKKIIGTYLNKENNEMYALYNTSTLGHSDLVLTLN